MPLLDPLPPQQPEEELGLRPQGRDRHVWQVLWPLVMPYQCKHKLTLMERSQQWVQGVVSGPKRCTLSGVEFDFAVCRGRPSECRLVQTVSTVLPTTAPAGGNDGAPFDKKSCYAYGKTLCKWVAAPLLADGDAIKNYSFIPGRYDLRSESPVSSPEKCQVTF